MTIQTLPNPILLPAVSGANTITTSLAVSMVTAMTFDASTDKMALVTMIQKSGTLTEVHFRTGVVSTAGATFQIQIEGVDASGNPDGTAKYTNANGTVVVATSDDNTWKTVSINGGTGVSVVKGDIVAIVLSVSSGTPNTVIISGAPPGNAAGFHYGQLPYIVQDTAGSWTKVTPSTYTWCLVLNYNGTYEQILGASAANAVAITAIGNDAERGMRFTSPFPMRCIGIRARLPNLAAGADFRARLYSGTTTVLGESLSSSVDMDGDWNRDATGDNFYDIFFPESISLAANTTYYATIWQKTANSVSLVESTVSVAGYMNTLGCGSNWYLCNRAAGGTGAWTETDTIRPDMYLWVDGFDDAAGSGGLAANPSRGFMG